jgi:hypothetical protein
VIGLVNLALALVCIASPAIGSTVGQGRAIALAGGLFAGAALMFLVARCFDRLPGAAFATPA